MEVVKKLENIACSKLGFKSSLLTNSGSEAIFLALENANIEKGTPVLLPIRTCKNVPNAVIEYGCTPFFCDVDDDLCLDISKAQMPLEELSAMVYIHTFGIRKDISKLINICKQKHITLVEDSAQYFCADRKYKTIPQGDYVVFSFGKGKPIMVGKYGLLASNKHSLKEQKAILDEDTDIQKLYEMIKFCDPLLKRKQEIANLFIDTLGKQNIMCNQDNYEENIHNKVIYRLDKNSEQICTEMKKRMQEMSIKTFQASVPEALNDVETVKICEDLSGQKLTLDEFPNYKKLSNQMCFFMTHTGLSNENIKTACKEFNDIISSK